MPRIISSAGIGQIFFSRMPVFVGCILKLASVAAAALALVGALSLAQAQDGSLDPTFNVGQVDGVQKGTAITAVGISATGNAVAIDAQGRIVVAGVAISPTKSHFALARYKSDGTLDTNSFMLSGKSVADFSQADTSTDVANAIAFDSQGRILVGGWSNVNGTDDFALARFTTGGVLDTTFNPNGSVPGVVFTDFNGGSDNALAMAVDSSGRFLLAGFTIQPGAKQHFAFARYNPDGTLDQTLNPASAFGPKPGLVVTNFTPANASESEDHADAIAVDGSGRIYLVGYTTALGSRHFAVARYSGTDGNLDSSFGFGGLVVSDLTPSDATGPSTDMASAVVVDSNQNIIVAGATNFTSSGPLTTQQTLFAVVRYLSVGGATDPSFGTNGLVTWNFENAIGAGGVENDVAAALALDGEGKILVAGRSTGSNSDTDFALVRLRSDGSLDAPGIETTTDFSISGVSASSHKQDQATSMTIDGQGRIVLAGLSAVAGPQEFALARYLGVSADMSVSMAGASTNATTTKATKGDTITYTITVRNNGPDTAADVAVTDTLPGSLTFGTCLSTGSGVCAGSGNNRTVTFGSITSGDTETITLTATLTATLTDGAPFVNTATIASATSDSNPGNNSASATLTEQKRGDLAVSIVPSETAALPGDTVTYTVTVRNNGPDDAQGVVHATSITQAGSSVALLGFTGNLPMTLAAGASASFAIQVTVGSAAPNGYSFVVKSTILVSTFDPDTTNNSASSTLVVLNDADVSITKSVAKTTSRQIAYTISVTNQGPYAARGLTVTDTLPAGTTFTSISPGAWACSTPAVGSTGTVTCTLANLPSTPPTSAVSTITLTVKVTVPGSVTITDTASVATITTDSVPANNSVTFSTKLSAK